MVCMLKLRVGTKESILARIELFAPSDLHLTPQVKEWPGQIYSVY